MLNEVLKDSSSDQLISIIKKVGITNFFNDLPEALKEELMKIVIAKKVINEAEFKVSKQLINEAEVKNSYINVLKEKNKKMFLWSLKVYEKWLNLKKIVFLDAVRTTALQFQDYLLNVKKLKNNSARKIIFVVRRIYDEFVLKNTITINPFIDLPKVKHEWKHREVAEYTEFNLKRIINEAVKRNYKDLAKAILICILFGLRWGEVLSFQTNGELVRWRAKNDRIRTEPLTKESKQQLLITEKSGYFKSYWKNKIPKLPTLRWHFKLIMNDLKLNWTPHDLRHFFARHLYSKTKDILKVKKALGHHSITSTDIYLNRDY